MKKSQASLFVLLGIVLILLIIMVIVFEGTKEADFIQDQIQEVRMDDVSYFMENCIYNEFNLGIPVILSQSGVYKNVNTKYVIFDTITVQYFYYNNTDLSLDISDIEFDLDLFSYDVATRCKNKYESLDKTRTVIINSLNVYLKEESEIHFQLTAIFNSSERSMSHDFEIAYPINQRILNLTQAAQEIIKMNDDDEYTLDIKKINHILQNYDFRLNIYNDNDDTLVYQLFDNSTDYYEFNFAAEYESYSCENIPVDDSAIMSSIIDLCLNQRI